MLVIAIRNQYKADTFYAFAYRLSGHRTKKHESELQIVRQGFAYVIDLSPQAYQKIQAARRKWIYQVSFDKSPTDILR